MRRNLETLYESMSLWVYDSMIMSLCDYRLWLWVYVIWAKAFDPRDVSISPLAFRCTLWPLWNGPSRKCASCRVTALCNCREDRNLALKCVCECVCACHGMCCCLQASAQTRMIRMIILIFKIDGKSSCPGRRPRMTKNRWKKKRKHGRLMFRTLEQLCPSS